MDSLKDPKFDILFDNLLNNPNFILFSGAGTSHYTGMPTGKELSEKLFDLVKRYDVDKNNWQETSQKIVDIHGRSVLNKVLKEVFNTEKISDKKYHDMLINNVMLKNIYTLNYDDLFEKENSNKINVIYEPSQIPEQDEKKINIFKLHGDLKRKSKIVLTVNDYRKFKKGIHKDPLIREFQVDLGKNIVIICGISFEDKHIEDIFKYLNKQLGENRKKVFYLSPNIDEKTEKLCKKLNFEYIKATFEEFTKWSDTFYKEKMPDIKGKVSITKLENIFPKVMIDNKKINLDMNINQMKMNVSGIDQVNNLQKFMNGETKEVKLNDIGMLNQYNDILISKSRNCDAVLKRDPHFYYKGMLKCDNELIENSKIKIFILKNLLYTKPKLEIQISFHDVVLILDIQLKTINDFIEYRKVEMDFNYNLNLDKVKGSMEYYLGIKKIKKILESNSIEFVSKKDFIFNTEMYKEFLEHEHIKNLIDHFNFELKYLKPITEKTFLEYHDFDGEQKQELINLEYFLRASIKYPSKDLKPMVIRKVGNEHLLSEFKKNQIINGVTVNSEQRFFYKNKNLKFNRTVYVDESRLDIGEDDIKIIPVSDIREKWKLVEEWIED